jgi:hypothetical protein
MDGQYRRPGSCHVTHDTLEERGRAAESCRMLANIVRRENEPPACFQISIHDAFDQIRFVTTLFEKKSSKVGEINLGRVE